MFTQFVHAIFETAWSGFIKILYDSSVSWKINLHFLAQTSYTLDTKSSSKWNFPNFEWLGENSPNSACHTWNCKSYFLQTFHHSSVSWEITLLYFFSWLLISFAKSNPSKCKLPDFRLLTLKLTTFLMLFFKPRVIFPYILHHP